MSLRAELLGTSPQLPDFAVMLPTDWISSGPDYAEFRARADARLEALPVAQRASARVQLAAILDDAAGQAVSGDVIRVFAPGSDDPDLFAPVSLSAAWVHAPQGASAADLGAQLISRYGAAPMDEAGTVLRWEETRETAMDGGSVTVRSISYVLPVPGRPRSVLMLRGTVLCGTHAAAVPDDAITAMTMICDGIAASVRWRRDA
ncbi:hypothetical protein [Microbacterium sp. NPDC057650]|uniref:hypothetical protein n=1 Tax=unclassified Microbacterium TaxID=2609290 RepID=UPI0036715B63